MKFDRSVVAVLSIAVLPLTGSGCSDADREAEAADAHEKARAEWNLRLDWEGRTVELPLERMDIFVPEDDSEYLEIFEIHGDDVVLVGQLPADLRVGFEEAFDRLKGQRIPIDASGGDPYASKGSYVLLNGIPVSVEGGTIRFDKVTGRWSGTEGDRLGRRGAAHRRRLRAPAGVGHHRSSRGELGMIQALQSVHARTHRHERTRRLDWVGTGGRGRIMTAIPAYERDPYLTILETEIVASRPPESLGGASPDPAVLLADTILYPEGGGQPSDRGTISGVEVRELRRTPEGVVHFLTGPLPAGPATVRLDWKRRYDHMQQHTGQHLLTAVAEDRFSWTTTAFHMGAEVSDIDLAVPRLSSGDLRLLEEAVAEEIRRARPVRSRRVSPEEFASARVRTRGLPEDHCGEIRLVEIEGIDLNTCGGTHLRSTSEIESVALLGTEAMRSGTRVYFVAGTRARLRLAEHEVRNAVLRTVLGAPDDQLGEVARSRIAALELSSRTVRRLEEQLADLHGDLLAAQVLGASDGFVEAHFNERDGGFLARCARRFASSSPDGIALLTASGPGGEVFVLVAGERRASVPRALGPRAAEMLEGRGGGAGALFQGKAGSLVRRGEVLAWLRSYPAE